MKLTVNFNSSSFIALSDFGLFDGESIAEIVEHCMIVENYIMQFDLEAFYSNVWKMNPDGGYGLLEYFESLTIDKYKTLLEVHNKEVETKNREMNARFNK